MEHPEPVRSGAARGAAAVLALTGQWDRAIEVLDAEHGGARTPVPR